MHESSPRPPELAGPVTLVASTRLPVAGGLTGERVRPGTPSASLGLDAMIELLEELDIGVIVCCEEGRVALANNTARAELQRGRPLGLDAQGALCLADGAQATLPRWRSALRAAVQAGRRQLVPLRDASAQLMVSVMPLSQRGTSWALVMIGRRQPAPELAIEMLGRLYDLTLAERSVFGSLLAGQRVDAIARSRGVKLSTLRSQVSSLRDKLGVARLEDLVRLAAELPPISSALRSPALHTIGHLIASHASGSAGARAA